MNSTSSIPRCCVLGRRSHIQPLAYKAFASLFAGELYFVAPQQAELLIFGHPDDLIEAASDLTELLKEHPEKRIIYLSEEPFWDTVGPIPPLRRQQVLETPAGPLPVTCLNHGTSDIFTCERIPYFLLTEEHFATRYHQLFKQNQTRTKEDWATHFARAPIKAAFVAENRISPKLNKEFPEENVKGLNSWRCQVAICFRDGPVLRAGRGWPQGAADRVRLPDWHADKLEMLKAGCHFISGLENTHQKTYISEKIFDAFALGGIPLYFASPDHDIHRILPANGWINLYDQSPLEAAATIRDFTVTSDFLDAYQETQAALYKLFSTPEIIAQEQTRLQTALLTELQTVRETAFQEGAASLP